MRRTSWPRWIPVLILVLLAIAPGNAGAVLTYEQREAIWNDFSQWDKAVGITATAYQEFLGTEASEKLIEGYGSAVFLMQLNKELLLTGDLGAAFQLVRDRIADSIIKELAPGFHSWLGWISAAKAGMELFKDLVFDPMVEQSQLDTYFGLRDAGYEPETAFASMRGIGHMMERAKVEFRRQRGDDPFVPGTNDLRPQIMPQFERFMQAGVETRYHEKLHRDFLERFDEETRKAEAELPRFRERLLAHLRQTQVGRVEIDPVTSVVRPGEQVALSATAIYADPGAPRSARDVSAEATWSGGTSDNIFLAAGEHVGRTITVTAEYAQIVGSAVITVISGECGEDGRWDDALGRCVCNDAALVWNHDLAECVPAEDEEGEADELLGDLEGEFYGAVRVFEESFGDFRARLQAMAGQPRELICSDVAVAFSLTRAAAAYDLVDFLLESARARVSELDAGARIHVMDEMRMTLFGRDHARIRNRAEGMPALLAQHAPGCDIEEVLAAGSRVAEGDQRAERGVDMTGGVGDGGGVDPGGLRFVPQGNPIRQEKTSARCSGGSLNLNVTSVQLPTEIRADAGTYTISVSLSWTSSGSAREDVSVVVSVQLAEEQRMSDDFGTWSGSRSLQFTFDSSVVDFGQPVTAVSVNILAGIMCTGGSADGAYVQVVQPYVRRGSE